MDKSMPESGSEMSVCMRENPSDRKVTCGFPRGHEGECSWGHGIFLEWDKPDLTPRQKLKQALIELAGSGDREDFKLVERVFAALPELRNE